MGRKPYGSQPGSNYIPRANMFLKYMPKKVAPTVKNYVKKSINRSNETRQYYYGQMDQTAMDNITTYGSTFDQWFAPTIPLIQMAQGDTVYDRDGDKIHVKGKMRAKIPLSFIFPSQNEIFIDHAQVANVTVYCRVMVVQFKKGYTMATLLTELNTGSTGLAGVERLLTIKHICHVLWSRVVKFDPTDQIDSTTTNFVSFNPVCTKLINATFKPKISTLEWLSNATGSTAPDAGGNIQLVYYWSTLAPQIAGSATPVAGNAYMIKETDTVNLDFFFKD